MHGSSGCEASRSLEVHWVRSGARRRVEIAAKTMPFSINLVVCIQVMVCSSMARTLCTISKVAIWPAWYKQWRRSSPCLALIEKCLKVAWNSLSADVDFYLQKSCCTFYVVCIYQFAMWYMVPIAKQMTRRTLQRADSCMPKANPRSYKPYQYASIKMSGMRMSQLRCGQLQ